MKYITWNEDLEVSLLREVTRIEPFAAEHGDLLSRWKSVSAGLADEEPLMTHRAARDHVESMLKAFKISDRSQRLSSGTDEDVTEKVQLLQDLLMRMEEVTDAKKRKTAKANDKQEAIESTGDKLCREAEVRVAKRARVSPVGVTDEPGEVALNELMTFEKKRHEDDHEYRMQRLKFDMEEQSLRRAQSSQMESIVGILAQLVGNNSKNQ